MTRKTCFYETLSPTSAYTSHIRLVVYIYILLYIENSVIESLSLLSALKTKGLRYDLFVTIVTLFGPARLKGHRLWPQPPLYEGLTAERQIPLAANNTSRYNEPKEDKPGPPSP